MGHGPSNPRAGPRNFRVGQYRTRVSWASLSCDGPGRAGPRFFLNVMDWAGPRPHHIKNWWPGPSPNPGRPASVGPLQGLDFFGYHFRDGLQPEMEPHFRTTSASETGVWIWVSTHSGRHKRSNEPKTATQLQNKPHLPVLRCPIPPRDTSGTHHELMEWDSDGPRSRDCGNHQAQRQPVSSRTRAVGVWENLN